jgi:hypothetical protein
LVKHRVSAEVTQLKRVPVWLNREDSQKGSG